MCLRENVGSDHEEKATVPVIFEVNVEGMSQEKGHTLAERTCELVV